MEKIPPSQIHATTIWEEIICGKIVNKNNVFWAKKNLRHMIGQWKWLT